MKNSFYFNPKGKKFLAIFAHADDADYGCGGTFLKWLKMGAKGSIVIVTNGDKGTNDQTLTPIELAELRRQEQLAASKFLGLENTWFLDYPDAHLEIDQGLKKNLVKIIREYKPDVVFTWDPSMFYSLKRNFINHPDHRAVGQAALDAIFPMARDFLTFGELQNEGLTTHAVTDVFLYNFDKPNFLVDITPRVEDKLKLLSFHKSQIDIVAAEKSVRSWNRVLGKKIGVTYAEGFIHIDLGKR